MFTRHTAEFAEVKSTLAVQGAMVNLGLDTMLETPNGWMAVSDLAPGDAVATLDGGFTPISWIGRAQPMTDSLLVPAGAAGNCSDLVLPTDTLLGIEAPLDYDATSDHVSLPLAAFEGMRGIGRGAIAPGQFRTLGFDAEEMIWAQTGMLVHARPMADAFFQTLRFADARALIALIDAGHYDLAQAA